MITPAWVADVFGALMVGAGIYCAGRLVAATALKRKSHRDVDLVHGVMAVAMAGMLVPRLAFIGPFAWTLIMGGFSAWFAFEVVRSLGHRMGRSTSLARRSPAWSSHPLGHSFSHFSMSGAMTYMFGASHFVSGKSPSAAMASMTGAMGRQPNSVALALLCCVVLLWSAVWETDAMGRWKLAGACDAQIAGQTTRGTEKLWLAPRMERVTHVVMSITMAYMLVLML